ARVPQAVQTSVGAGHPIPFVYGRTRVGGQIIESFETPDTTFGTIDDEFTVVPGGGSVSDTSRKLAIRVALGWGPMKSVSDIRINKNPISLFRGTNYKVHRGTAEKPVPKIFGETKTTVGVGDVVSNLTPIERQTLQP